MPDQIPQLPVPSAEDVKKFKSAAPSGGGAGGLNLPVPSAAEIKKFKSAPPQKKNPIPTGGPSPSGATKPSSVSNQQAKPTPSASSSAAPKPVSVTPAKSKTNLFAPPTKKSDVEKVLEESKRKLDVTSPTFGVSNVNQQPAPKAPQPPAPKKVGALEDIGNTFMSSVNRFAGGIVGIPNMSQKSALMMASKMHGIDDEYNSLSVTAKKELDNIMSATSTGAIPNANISREAQDYFIKKSNEFLDKTNKSDKFLNERISDFYKAPSVEKAADLFLEIPKGFAESLPYMINPVLGAVSAASEQYNKDVQEAGGKLGWGQLVNAGVTGVSEFFIERISNGILNRSVAQAIGAPKVAKELAKGFVKSVLKDVGMEGAGEGLTEFVQSLSNDITKGKEINWVETANRTLDASIKGSGVAGGMRTTGAGVGYLAAKVMPKSDKNKVDRNTRAIMDLNTKKGPDNSPEVNSVIDSKIGELNMINIDIINNSVNTVKSLSDDQLKEIIRIDKDMNDIWAKREPIAQDPNLSDEEKQSLLDHLKSQYETLNQQKDAIQKQTTSEVPVQPEAGTGLQVAEGEPQAEPQVPTQESNEQKIEALEKERRDAHMAITMETESMTDEEIDNTAEERLRRRAEINNKFFSEIAELEKQTPKEGQSKEVKDEDVILSGLSNGFKAITPNSFDPRSDEGVSEKVQGNKSFATTATIDGKKYAVVGLKLTQDVGAKTSGRDGYTFAAIEDNGNLPDNVVDILTQKAVANTTSVYPNITDATIDSFKPIEVSDVQVAQPATQQPQVKSVEAITADIPKQDLPKVMNLVDRIEKGEQPSSPEDLQIQQNYPKQVEELLTVRAKDMGTMPKVTVDVTTPVKFEEGKMPEISADQIDWEASKMGNIYDAIDSFGGINDITVVDVRGKNAQGQYEGKVRITGQDTSREGVVVFKDPSTPYKPRMARQRKVSTEVAAAEKVLSDNGVYPSFKNVEAIAELSKSKPGEITAEDIQGVVKVYNKKAKAIADAFNKKVSEETQKQQAPQVVNVEQPTSEQPTKEQPTAEQPVEEPKQIKVADAESIEKQMQTTFGLNKTQSKAAAVVIDKIAGTMAKRAGTTKSKIMDAIAFKKGDINELSDQALFQKAKPINAPKEDIQKAVNEITSMGKRSPFGGNEIFMPNGTVVQVSNFDGSLFLDAILTPENSRGKGLATETMVNILNVASKYNVPVSLTAQPFGAQKDLTKKQLIDWYKKLGFKDIGYGELQKAPSVVLEEVSKQGQEIKITPVAKIESKEKRKMPEGAKLVKPENFFLDGEYDVVVNGKTIGNIYYDRASKTWNDPNFDRNKETPYSFKWIYGEILGENKEEAVTELIKRYKQFPEGVKPKGDVLFQLSDQALYDITLNGEDLNQLLSVGFSSTYKFMHENAERASRIVANNGGTKEEQDNAYVSSFRKSLNDLIDSSIPLLKEKVNKLKNNIFDREGSLSDLKIKRLNRATLKLEAIELAKEKINSEFLKRGDFSMSMVGLKLFQNSPGKIAKGAMQLASDGSAIIYALTDPDVSTPLHEMAHVYENYLTEDERKSVLDWAGKKDWDMPVSEKFARGFEKYLAEGKAPSKELTKIFDSFKKWLLDIYNGIVGSEIDIKLNDDMRKIYDTMLTEGEEVGIKELPGYARMMGEVDGIIEKSMNRGVPFNKTMDNAINYMEKSKVYEDATDIQREAMVREVRKMFDKKEKKAPTAQKILGQKPTKTTITVDESKELNKRLKALEAAEETGRKIGYKEGLKESEQARKGILDYVKSLKVNNKISGSQFKAIVNALKANLLNPVIRKRVEERIDKIIKKANYADQLERSNKLRAAIKKASKSKTLAANIAIMAKKFAKVNPNNVENLDEYIDMANLVYNSIGKPMRTIAEEAMVNEYSEMKIKEAQEAKSAGLEDLFNSLVKQGLIPKNLSLAEVQQYVLEEEQNKKVEESEQREKEKRDVLDIVFNALKDISNVMLNDGYNPFTGEDVTLSTEDRQLLKDFTSMDLSKLPISSGYRAQEALMNYIVNGRKFGMRGILARYQGAENVKVAVKKGLKAADFRWAVGGSWWGSRKWAKEVESIPGLFTWLFRGRTRGREVMKLMGLDEFMAGAAEAKIDRVSAENEYIAKFLNKKPNGKRFNNINNTYERLVYAYLSRSVDGSAEEKQAEFDRRKRILAQNVQAMEQSRNKDLIEEAQVLKRELNKAKDAKNADELNSKFDTINIQAVEFISGKFDEYFDKVDEVAEGIYNLILSKDDLYTPDMFRDISEKEINVAEMKESVDIPFDLLNKKPVGTMLENKRIPNLPGYDVKNNDASKVTKILKLDFDSSAFNALEKSLTDTYTAEAVQKYSAFVKSDEFSKLFDNVNDEKLFKEIVNYYINNERGKVGYKSDWKAVQNFSTRLKNFSTYRALGSATAFLKQSASAMVNTSINLSNDPYALSQVTKAMVGDPGIGDFINRSRSEINLRGAEATADIKSAEKLIRESKYQGLTDVLDTIDKLGRFQMKSLSFGDVPMARASWFGYYVHALKIQGKPYKNIDWSKAKLDKDAATYANTEVSINQNASMPSTLGQLFSSKNPLTRLTATYLFPFTSFLFNAKSRLKTDITVLTSKLSTPEDKQAAGRSIVATLAEMPAYIAISTSINYALVGVANAFLGYDEDEEDEKLRLKRYSELAVTRIITDLLSPTPNVGDVATVAAFNALLEKMQEDPDMEEEEKKDIFKLFESKPESMLSAMTELLFQPISSTGRRTMDIYNTIDMAIGDVYVTDSGKEIQFLDEEKKMLKIAAAIQIMGSLNLLPSEAESLAKKMVKTIEKSAKEDIN